MRGAVAIDRDYGQEGMKWRLMLGLSLLMHGVLFSTIFWVSWNGSGSLKMNEVVYEVNLVDASELRPSKGAQSTVQKTLTPADNRQARRIYTPSKKSNAIPLARRTVKRITPKPKKAEASSSQLLDKAISNIEKKVKTEDKSADYLNKAIAALDKKESSSGEETSGRGTSIGGLAINMYKADVETLIKSYWSYPDIGNQKKLEAVVLVKVKKDGTVLETSFIKRSGNNIFNESVLKAIEKAKPLPPLPEGYEKNYEEIEINFNLKDLE